MSDIAKIIGMLAGAEGYLKTAAPQSAAARKEALRARIKQRVDKRMAENKAFKEQGGISGIAHTDASGNRVFNRTTPGKKWDASTPEALGERQKFDDHVGTSVAQPASFVRKERPSPAPAPTPSPTVTPQQVQGLAQIGTPGPSHPGPGQEPTAPPQMAAPAAPSRAVAPEVEARQDEFQATKATSPGYVAPSQQFWMPQPGQGDTAYGMANLGMDVSTNEQAAAQPLSTAPQPKAAPQPPNMARQQITPQPSVGRVSTVPTNPLKAQTAQPQRQPTPTPTPTSGMPKSQLAPTAQSAPIAQVDPQSKKHPAAGSGMTPKLGSDRMMNEKQAGGLDIPSNRSLRGDLSSNPSRTALALGALLAGGAGLGGLAGIAPGASYGGLMGIGAGAERGHPVRGLGRGLVRGGMTGAGAGAGGTLGTILGGLAGGLGSHALGGNESTTIDSALIGNILGGLAGAGLGGYGGYNLGGAMLGEPKRTPRDEEEKQSSANIGTILGQKAAMCGSPCKVTKLSITTHKMKPKGGGGTPSETDQALSREMKSAADDISKQAAQMQALLGKQAMGEMNPGGGPAATGQVPVTGPVGTELKLPNNAAGMPQAPANIGQTNLGPQQSNLGV